MQRISSALAHLRDAAALDELLAPMRDGVALKRKLRIGFCGHQYTYDGRTRVARCLLTNGEIVACYSVAEVSLQEAKWIALSCEELREWSMNNFRAAVERALQAKVTATDELPNQF
jgi:hypothetical protein